MAIIRLENMEFYAYHGCFAEEAIIGTYFRVDVALETDVTLAEHTDNISDAVNYLNVYQLIKKEMGKPSHLLETVTKRIGDTLLEAFPKVSKVWIKTSKLNPPLGGKLAAVCIENEFSR